jgi:hypothetical protein
MRDDEIREAVDHGGRPDEAGCGVDHAEHPEPGADAVEIPKLVLQG